MVQAGLDGLILTNDSVPFILPQLFFTRELT